MTQAHLHAVPLYLGEVKACRIAQLKADAAYIAAIREAHNAGHSYTAIGLAAGVTRQAARLTMIRNTQGG